ncbi:MAG: cation:proton antiporter [Thermoplasmata archaeon]|nr:MAG: cation:proton antiporter [Thermoplasmata archaeon]
MDFLGDVEPVELIILQLFIIFLFAKIAGEIFERLKQPPLIGELIVGIVLGTAYFHSALELESSEEILEVLSELGVIFLLFIIGLETKFSDLRRVGKLAITVGILGVVFPLMFGVVLMLAWGGSIAVAAFVGTAMVATSIGITAHVLRDMGVMKTKEAKIIMGAAVIDDVMGMIVLTVVTGFASEHHLSLVDLLIVIIEAVVFVLAVMYLGGKIIRKLAGEKIILGLSVTDKKSDRIAKIQHKNAPFILALILCLGLSAVAVIFFRLAAIIGAFLAGMMFAEVRERYGLVEKMEPMNDFLLPFFFVFIGMQVNLLVLYDFNLVILIIILTVLAVAGKLIGSAVGTRELDSRQKLIIGVGMVPRGEVGIIVASVGLSLAIITDELYSVIIFMSIITTLLAPPLLKQLFSKKS